MSSPPGTGPRGTREGGTTPPQGTGGPRVRLRVGWNRSTSVALSVLVGVQVVVFYAVTRASFFFSDDFAHFRFVEDEGLSLSYLTSPVFQHLAPGHRLATWMLHSVAPLNYRVALIASIGLLVAATVALVLLVRLLADRGEWWTVVLVVPFGLGVTLVDPVLWWSNAAHVLPSLFLTVVALYAWVRSYGASSRGGWAVVAILAVVGAGAFYAKFLLIPVYLLFLRLWVLPVFLPLKGDLWALWRERVRWAALGIAPALYLVAMVASGLLGQTVTEGSESYLAYIGTAWFGGFVPAAFLNEPLTGADPAVRHWTVVLASQAVLWLLVLVTWRWSRLALRGWALLGVVFAANIAMTGATRLQAFGLEVAYVLRYYPEVVLFIPLVLALAVRRGAERRPRAVEEGSRAGAILVGVAVVAFCASFVGSAPRVVSSWPGVEARAWFDSLQGDLRALDVEGVGLVDAELPEFVMPSWFAPVNVVSTVVEPTDADVRFDVVDAPLFAVGTDGHLRPVRFSPAAQLVDGRHRSDELRTWEQVPAERAETCFGSGGGLEYAGRELPTEGRIGIRYVVPDGGAPASRIRIRGTVGEAAPDSLFEVELGQDRLRGVLDLGSTPPRTVTVEALDGVVCFEDLTLGALRTVDGDRS